MRRAHLSSATDRILPQILSQQAESIGDDLFLIQDDKKLTYGQTSELADRHANAYMSMGIGQGDTVAFLMENSLELAATSFGVNRLGAIWSPISTEYRGEWLASLLTKVRSDVLVVDGKLLHNVIELGDLGFKHIVVKGDHDTSVPAGLTVHRFDDLAEHPATRPDVSLDYGNTNAVLWTSGTTGPSKGVEQSHNAWITFSLEHNRTFRDEIRDGERFYGCVPMYNSGGWISNIYPALLSGVAATIDERFSVSRFWDRIRFYEANHTMVLGTMPLFLMQQPPTEDDAENPLRTTIFNPPIPGLVEKFMERFAVERVGSGFGQSEIMGCTLWHSGMKTKPGSQGIMGADGYPVDTKLLDDHDNEVAVGEIGEICVRPNRPYSIFNGYFKEPDKTLEAFSNLWYHTGDLGRGDESGELFFVDRKKDSTRNRGRNISSFEVEHIARQFPEAANVAAVGVPSSQLEFEDELLLYVVPAEGQSVDPLALCQFIDEKAPYFFVPRFIMIVDSFPMTPTNKIQKFKLRDVGLPDGAWDRLAEAPDWKPVQKKPAPAPAS